ncbi:NAD(P)H-dependent oxidoreductase [Metabacillus sp. RGM 3146]|uniref:NAD(P)H-dependent oxidoreductase n=1 Tax=Metabacillus sp. RGM 3146 TaxID=3401092 RepID=UPI003B9B18DF
MERDGHTVRGISVLDVDPKVLVQAEYDHPTVREIAESIQKADGVIIASPVYKAAYSGVLKTLLDLLPRDALKEKPLMIGGSQAHLLAIDYSFKPLLAALHAQTILRGVYLTDPQIDKTSPLEPINEADLEERISNQLKQFIEIAKKLKSIPE